MAEIQHITCHKSFNEPAGALGHGPFKHVGPRPQSGEPLGEIGGAVSSYGLPGDAETLFRTDWLGETSDRP